MTDSPSAVLVVDDNADNRDLLSRHLHRQGHQVSLAEDGHEALALLTNQPFDMVLLDIMMPGMNGYQVLEHLKDDPALHHIPVVVVSAANDFDSVVRCIELGAEDYLFKPFNTTLLRARVSACLEKKRWRDREAVYRVELEKSRDDLASILNQLHLGTVMTDAAGCVTFVSASCHQLLGKTPEQVLGRSWEALCPVSLQEKALLQGIMQQPPTDRRRVPLLLRPTKGKTYAVEVDVQDDPRNPQRKIFFIYDVTEVYDLRLRLKERTSLHGLVGQSEAMIDMHKRIGEVAQVDATVIIGGETGTGKELVARAIHDSSPRKEHPFIVVNCAGLTESLLNSQLFGHKRGSFTGATEDQQGFFETANGGTIFLDEIGDMPLNMQASLLRVLQEKEIVRLGESKPRKVDARVLAATNRNLREMVAKGEFREDLLYRLRVARLDLPPLRDRREDIPLLVESFLRQAKAMTGKEIQEVSTEAMQCLLEHPWPGNVRELKSAIEYAVIYCHETVLQPQDLPPEMMTPEPLAAAPPKTWEADKERIVDALKRAKGNRRVAAQMLGVSRATLYRHLTNFDISTER